jgi:hypothetical protein
MKKFFIMTRGRTGSTAVIDSLNLTNEICAAQELFLKYNFNKNTIHLIVPFDLWQERGILWPLLRKKLFSKKTLIKEYLRKAEDSAMSTGKMAFGFKVLSHHFDERSGLKCALLERGYHTIYLTRNIPRQVISGMVAKLRGKYNARTTENYNDDSRYTIDINEFESLVKWEVQAATNDLNMLKTGGGRFIEVRYEDFLADRQVFFNHIFDFLGISAETPQPSKFSIMIKDISHVVENYQAVAESAAAIGINIE